MPRRIAFLAAAILALAAPLVAHGDETPGASPSAGAETPVPAAGDAALEVLATGYYQAEWKFRPSDATGVGIHTYDDQLGPVTPAAIAARDSRLQATLRKLQSFDRTTLSLDGQADLQILENAIQENLFWDQQWPTWQRQPSYYTDIASDGVYRIMSRDFAPLDQRLRSVIAREREIPALLAQGEKNLDVANTSQVVASIGQRDAAGAVDFFTDDVPKVFGHAGAAALQSQFASANAAAVKAFVQYAAFLKASVVPRARGSYAIGAANYDRLERLQNVSDIPLARLLAIGEADLAKNKAAFVATARQIDASKTPQQVLGEIRLDHPSNAQLINAAQADLDQLVSFIKRN
ncbi:MAG: DUF885 family protein, partial [Candidatus Eremiobacteraeota bacterium]|nr:DUF885 family protein [Candidatus Eremiobacteraeota bacterium]